MGRWIGAYSFQFDINKPANDQAAQMAIEPLQPNNLYLGLDQLQQSESFTQVFPMLYE